MPVGLRDDTGIVVQKILIGYDGSDESRDAVVFAWALAAACRAHLALGACFPLDGELDSLSWGTLEERSRRLFDPVLADLGDPLMETHAAAGSASRALVELSAQMGADLTVVGSCHRGRLGRLLLGSTAAEVIQRSQTPVAVVPRGWRFRGLTPFRELMVADDGSMEAGAAHGLADEIRQATGASLRLVRVPPHSGNPALSLLAQVGEADLVLMGSRGYVHLAGTLRGSVSSHMVRALPCPLLVVPTKAARASQTASPLRDDVEAATV